jgi:hypothetical protein
LALCSNPPGEFELSPETLSTDVNLIFERLFKEEQEQRSALENAIHLLRNYAVV